MSSSNGHGLDLPTIDANTESRAFFSLCAVKEFLVVVLLFLICADLFDIYANLVRVTGTELLPFPGNHTELYYTRIAELNWYDLIVSTFDLVSVVLLSLSVCANSLDGLVCSLCGFASSMLLEFVYILWMAAAVAVDSVQETLTPVAVGFLLIYTLVPYVGMLIIRMYTLSKAQAFRRSLKRNAEFRRKFSENSGLLNP